MSRLGGANAAAAAVLCLLFLFVRLGEGDMVFPDSVRRSPRAPPTRRPAQPSTPATPTFTEQELQCFVDQKVLYTDGKCYGLRHTGPCNEGSWLVLDKDVTPLSGAQGRRRLVCKTMPCNGSSRIYWPETDECVRQSQKSRLCPYAGNDLRRDSYGDGECACVAAHARLESDVLVRNSPGEWKWDGDCLPLYRKGPCSNGKVLVPKHLDGFGTVGTCASDPCHDLNARNPGSSYARRSTDGRCYKIGAKGAPCSADETFGVHLITNKAQCVSRVQQLSLYGDMPERCLSTNKLTGDCREEVLANMKSMDYVLDISGQSPRRKRRAG